MNRESQAILEGIRANLAKVTTGVDVLYSLLAADDDKIDATEKAAMQGGTQKTEKHGQAFITIKEE